MGYFVRNLHVLGFAAASIAAAVWVGTDTQRARNLVEMVADDAAELQHMAETSYKAVNGFANSFTLDEAVMLYAAVLQMPTKLLERLGDQLEDANTRIGSAVPTGNRPHPKEPVTSRIALDYLRKL